MSTTDPTAAEMYAAALEAARPPSAMTGASATGANAALTATLAGAAGKTTYITGFQVTGGGATAATIIDVTLTGLLGGTQTFKLPVPAGPTAGLQPLIVPLRRGIPAAAPNTPIVINVPAFGLGNLHAAVAAQGYQL